MNNPQSQPHNHLPWLIGGDLLMLLIFVAIGRNSHGLSLTDIKESLPTAASFVAGWFLVTPWFGLFRPEVSRMWQKLVPRLLLAWTIGGSLALVLRAWLLGRAVIPASFIIVGLGFSTLFLLSWRLGYSAWVNRRQSAHQAEL